MMCRNVPGSSPWDLVPSGTPMPGPLGQIGILNLNLPFENTAGSQTANLKKIETRAMEPRAKIAWIVSMVMALLLLVALLAREHGKEAVQNPLDIDNYTPRGDGNYTRS